MNEKTDVIVVGAGLAGLVAATEVAEAGKRVVVVDQEARTEPRRASILVAGRVVHGGYARAAPLADQRLV